jgi:hypothetical protein
LPIQGQPGLYSKTLAIKKNKNKNKNNPLPNTQNYESFLKGHLYPTQGPYTCIHPVNSFKIRKYYPERGTVVHICNPSIQEVETIGL